MARIEAVEVFRVNLPLRKPISPAYGHFDPSSRTGRQEDVPAPAPARNGPLARGPARNSVRW